MKDLVKNWRSFLFNLSELVLILISGYFLGLSTIEIVIVVLLFCSVRMITKSAMHYKSWKKCLCWSLLLVTSLFILVKVNILIAIIMTIFSALIISEKGNINDCFMYQDKKEEGKYRELKQYVEKNKNTEEIKEFEDELKRFSNKYSDRYKINLYTIYKLIFYEKNSYEVVKKKLNLRDDNHLITNALDMIFISYNTYIDIKKNHQLEKRVS